MKTIMALLCIFIFFFKVEAGFVYVALSSLELQIRPASNSLRSICFCLSSTEIQGMRHMPRARCLVFLDMLVTCKGDFSSQTID